MLNNLLQKIFTPRQKYQPIVKVLVFKNALLHNLEVFKSAFPKLLFSPVLKSNAYGHGLTQTARILDKQNCPFFSVDSFYEALTLRQAGINTPILVIGYSTKEQMLNCKMKNLSFVIVNIETLREISVRANSPILIHLKIDTGMHRQGIMPEELDEALKLSAVNANIILDGVCSHLADADGENGASTDKQIELWNSITEKIKINFPNVKYFHLSNTAGWNYAEKINANVARLGIGLYGINPMQNKKLNLKPALALKTIITSLRNIKAGEKVGYNFTFTAPADMKIATIPVGYFEGVDRRLSNKGFVKIHGQFCKIVGRVSMNITSVDVGNLPQVKVGDEAVVISADAEDKNSAENIAKECVAIAYEILVHIPQHLRREVI